MATGPPTYGLQTPKETTAEQLDQTMNPGPNIPWLNFSGSPEESVITFIQSVQRVAIMLNNMYEDRWLAHYAAACLGGAALLWYSELDDETCDSWKKLRKALLANYYAIKPGAGTLNSVPAPQSWDLAAPASLTSPPSPPISLALTESPSSSAVLIEKRGRVEVFRYDYPESLGFIGPGFSVVPNQGQAAVFTFAQNPDGAPFALHREGALSTSYLGLVLFRSDGNAPKTVPPALIDGLYSISHIVQPSQFCIYKDQSRREGEWPIATWILGACSEGSTIPRYRRMADTSGSRRASSQIWQYNEKTDELSMTWMMDDDTEAEIGALMRSGQQNLHFHRLSDSRIADHYLDEFRVKFYFIPDSDKKTTYAKQLGETTNPGPNIPWLNFSGSPEESVATFIQSVQRAAITLNNMYEDRWLAHYAAAFLSGAALLWYLELDDETCDSWKKLRKALVAKYYILEPDEEGSLANLEFRYLGLMLLSTDVEGPKMVPAPLSSYSDVQRSPLCGNKIRGNVTAQSLIATWVLGHCSKGSTAPRYRRIADSLDSDARASSQIWRYNEKTDELTMVWMMDDRTEVEIAALMQSGQQCDLHFHRLSDSGRAGHYLAEFRVLFYFTPDREERATGLRLND